MANEMNDNPDRVKRIVLVGYPGSGKTMLAIGLFHSSRRKGATISVKDPTTIDTLSRAVAEIQTKKKFAAATTIIKEPSAEQTERKTYSFNFLWRGQGFRIEFEDYAGERTSNPDYIKQFDDIIGNRPYGAILLLNPGMALFKPTKDIPGNVVQGEVKKWAALPKFYTAVVNELCEKGCKNLVLAVTASDRISKGGDLCQTEQCGNFKKVLEEIRCSFKNAKKKYGRVVDFKVVHVTVTGRLKYNEDGEPEEEHLAESGENTAADPFLWIIDPWRRWFHKFIRWLSWSVPVATLLLTGMYFGGQAVQRYVVGSNLDKAEDLLGNFGDFDMDKGTNTIAEAEACLKKANEAWTFLVSDKVKMDHDKRLSALLGTLMTNQVKLAYRNSRPNNSSYFEPNRTLDGAPEFALWSYWMRSSRCNASHDAALTFREQKTQELVSETLKSNVEYLIKEFEKLIKASNDGNPADEGDEEITRLFKHTFCCLSNQMLDERRKKNLKMQRDQYLEKWKKYLADRINPDGGACVNSRIIKTISVDTGLDVGEIIANIFALHKKELYTAYKTTADEYKRKIENGDLQHIANDLAEYLHVNSNSPYKWIVLEAAKRRFNEAVSNTKSSSAGRKENFESIFQAARHLHRALDTNVFCEAILGDNALYWLAPKNRDEWPSDSRGWLRYTFHCDAVAVRTDHASKNPGSERFARNVDAQLTLSFEPRQDGYPKDIGGERFLNYAEIGGERDIGESESWIPIPNSSIDVEMGATDVLKIRVKPGEEDWKWDVDIPGGLLDFWPGWGDYESAFTYASKRDIYPQDAYYGVHLLKIRLEGGPKQAFEDALVKAKAREPAIKAKRETEVSEANALLKNNNEH